MPLSRGAVTYVSSMRLISSAKRSYASSGRLRECSSAPLRVVKVSRELITVTNATVVNTVTMCELLKNVAAEGLSRPITMVLYNARYQRNAETPELAKELVTTLLSWSSYSPNMQMIKRLLKFMNCQSLYGCD